MKPSPSGLCTFPDARREPSRTDILSHSVTCCFLHSTEEEADSERFGEDRDFRVSWVGVREGWRPDYTLDSWPPAWRCGVAGRSFLQSELISSYHGHFHASLFRETFGQGLKVLFCFHIMYSPGTVTPHQSLTSSLTFYPPISSLTRPWASPHLSSSW